MQLDLRKGLRSEKETLSVELLKPPPHLPGKGWEKFTDAIIQAINNQKEHVVFILWGAYAQKKGVHIDASKHYVVKGVHPSPLSAYRGFYGSKPFSKTNDFLEKSGKGSIDWRL